MADIKRIQTKYRGYHFRSRLEARWAVFFDAANMRWEFEPEGFHVDNNCYLPDFFLPDLDCYFEVKGRPGYNIDMLQRFAHLIKKPLIVAEGDIPDPKDCTCGERIGLQFLHSSRPEEWPDGVIDDVAYGYKDMFLRCDGCGKIHVMNENYSSMKEMCGCDIKGSRIWPLSDALNAARSARFEHGESPSTLNHPSCASTATANA